VASDEAALERDRSEGAEAFDALFRRHQDVVTKLCRRLLGTEAAAQDATHEVFLRARRGFDGYDPKRPFRRWLLGVASHHCIDQLRRRGREAHLFEAGDLDPADLADPGPSPLARMLGTEERERVLAAIDALPHKYRLPLVLRYFEDLDYAGIAELLRVSTNQVGTLLFRARRRLREDLAGGGGR
jgi:RNA polymerase sigma-70 factor (ECF subfamily)